MKKKFRQAILPLLGAGLLIGCVSDRAPAAFVDNPYYPMGYSDGCSSAIEGKKNFSTKTERDTASFKTDPGYRSGWRQGYIACNRDSELREGDGGLRGEQDPFL